MSLYQGRALQPGRRVRRRGAGPLVLRLVLLAGLAFLLAHLPWGTLRRRVAVVDRVRIEGAHYLDAVRVAAVAGIHEGQDLFAVDLARARQALLLDPRIARAEVRREWPRGVRVSIVERVPVLLVQHGVPWEVDSAGVLLPPLAKGVVADVPLLAGPDFARQRAGTQVLTPQVRRGLAWVRAMAARELQLSGQVSQVDVSDPWSTGLLLMSGTRVLAPAWPPGTRKLSALRVVLADLQHRGTIAQEIDLRFQDQVIVRPVPPARAAAAARPHRG